MRNLKLFFLVSVMLIGISNAWAKEYNLELSSNVKFGTTSGSSLTQNNCTWIVSFNSNGAPNSYNSDYDGQQFGTKNDLFNGNFSTSSLSNESISKIEIVANTGGAATLSVQVGEISFLCNNNDPIANIEKSNKNPLTYTFTGVSKGTIVINLSATNAAAYLKSIIVYTDDVSRPTHEVFWFVNGEPYTEGDPTAFVMEGSQVTKLPDSPQVPEDCAGKVFVGWTNEPITKTDTRPDILFTKEGNSPVITQETKFHAVFADLISEGTDSEITDIITSSTTGVTGTSYTSWKDKVLTSGAYYSGTTATNNSQQIQINTTSPQGIVSTVSGGILKKVVINWGTGSTNDLYIYGSVVPYSGSGALYATETQGTIIGTVSSSTSPSVIKIPDGQNYYYIGVKSAKSAKYISSIEITWVHITEATYTNYTTTCSSSCDEFINLTASVVDGCENMGYVSWSRSNWEQTQTTKGENCESETSVSLYVKPENGYKIKDISPTVGTISQTAVNENVYTYTLTYKKEDVDEVKEIDVSVSFEMNGKEYRPISLANINQIWENDEVIIVSSKDGNNWALPSDENTSSAPSAIDVGNLITSKNTLITDKENILWNILFDCDGTFLISSAVAENAYLYHNKDTGDKVRVGNNKTNPDYRIFTTNNGYLFEKTNGTYLGVYITNNEWRCYKDYQGSSNIAGQTFTLYVWSPTEPIIAAPCPELTGFKAVYGRASEPQEFTVKARNLKENLEITAPDGFEVSTTKDNGYQTSIELTPASENEQTIYVRLAAGKNVGAYSGNITILSTDATKREVSVSGEITCAEVQLKFTENNYELNLSGSSVTSVGGLLSSLPGVEYTVEIKSDDEYDSDALTFNKDEGSFTATAEGIWEVTVKAIGNYCGETSCMVLVSCAEPDVPKLSITDITITSAKISWNEIDGADYYTVEITGDNNYNEKKVLNDTWVVFDDLSPNSNYLVEVTVTNICGESSNSEISEFNTESLYYIKYHSSSSADVHIITAEKGGSVTSYIPDNCSDGRVFIGWSESIVDDIKQDEPDIKTYDGALDDIQSDIELYAVFANRNGGKVVDTTPLGEDFESYTPKTTYDQTGLTFINDNGLSWQVDNGNVTTTGADKFINSSQCVLLRNYPNQLATIKPIKDLMGISVMAAKSATKVSGNMFWSDVSAAKIDALEVKELTINNTTQGHNTNVKFEYPRDLYVNFECVRPNDATNNDRLYIDDIVFTIAIRDYFYTDYSLKCNESVSRNITWKDDGKKLEDIKYELDNDKLILPALSKENHLFKGWKAEIDETDYSEIYAAGDLYIVNHKVTFTAQWEKYIESVTSDIAPITSYVGVSTQSATTGYIELVKSADASVLAKPQAVIVNKEDGEVNTHFSVVPGDYDETNHRYPFTVAYEPTDKDYDKIEKVTIYFTFGNVLQTEAIEVSARSLPKEFVIAVKIPDSDQWVALPNDLKGKQSEQKSIVPVGIVVDNPDRPTKANIVPENAIYTACKRYNKDNVTALRFTVKDSDNNQRYLQVTNSESEDAKTVMWLAQSGGNGVQDWYLKSDENFGPYSLTIPDNRVPGKQMGMIDNLYMGYSLEPANAEIYILPFVSVLDIVPTEVTEWGKNSVIVAPSGISNIQSAKVRMGSGTEQEPISIEAINGNLGGTKNIKITTEFDFSKSENQTLYIDWYNADKLISSSQIIVPLVIAEDYAISSDNKYKNWTEREVHVLPNATLSTGRFTNNYVEINKVVVYPNATLQVDKELRITDFCLNNGWSRTGEKSFYGAANVFLNFDDYPNKEDVKLSATTAYIDLDLFERVGSSMQTHYYSFAVPCSVAVKDIKYADTSLDGIAQYGQHYVIKRYDSESRATSGMNHDNNNWVPVEDTDTEILEPGKGYIITALSVGGEAKLRIPLDKMDWSAINTSVKVSKYTSTSANKSDAGWNMIAVHGQNKAKVTNGVNYLTVPTIEFDKYQQADISEFDVMPGYGFFVQVNASEDAAEPDPIEFKFIKPGSASSNTAKSIIARRVAREKDIRMRLVLENEQESDRTTILTGEDYTTDYEIGYDLEKMFGDGNCLQVYTLSAGSRLAFNALPTDALQDIPVGYIAPKAGEYMFTIPEDYDTSGVEGIYLTDKVEERTYDLMWTDYVFNTQAGTNNNRFTLWLKVKAPETTTNIDNGGNNEWGVQAIGMEKNIMLRNLPLGADVYVLSMDGKLVNSVKSVSNSRANIPVSMSGVYNVRVMQGKEAITLKVIVR